MNDTITLIGMIVTIIIFASFLVEHNAIKAHNRKIMQNDAEKPTNYAGLPKKTHK